MNALVEQFTQFWTKLSAREQKLMAILGGVALLMVFALPLFILSNTIESTREENSTLQALLNTMEKDSAKLRTQRAKEEAAKARYKEDVPVLASYVESAAKSFAGLNVSEITEQPQIEEAGFLKKHVRVKIPNVDLKTSLKFIHELENSPSPIALERIHIDHYGTVYNLQIGLISYEPLKETGSDQSKEEKGGKP